VTVPSVDFLAENRNADDGVSTGARRKDEMTNGQRCKKRDEQNAGYNPGQMPGYSRSRRERSQRRQRLAGTLAVPERLSIAKARCSPNEI